MNAHALERHPKTVNLARSPRQQAQADRYRNALVVSRAPPPPASSWWIGTWAEFDAHAAEAQRRMRGEVFKPIRLVEIE